ncbi:MAG: leukotriene A4 hydrolase C-terminal domain-containing protein, partial [Crocinitomicaceae bacterium]
NAEIKAEWFVKAIENNYHAARPYMAEFLTEVGRRKFLEPIYQALADQSADDMNFAKDVYENARVNYHAVSYQTIDEILGM